MSRTLKLFFNSTFEVQLELGREVLSIRYSKPNRLSSLLLRDNELSGIV